MSERGGWTRSRIVAGVVGVFAGGLVIFLLESLGHRLFGTADPTDLSSVTGPMFASVLVAWVVGSGVAGGLATHWAGVWTQTLGLVMGLILLAAAASNMLVIPHPVWMMVAAVVLMPLAALLAARFVIRRRAAVAP